MFCLAFFFIFESICSRSSRCSTDVWESPVQGDLGSSLGWKILERKSYPFHYFNRLPDGFPWRASLWGFLIAQSVKNHRTGAGFDSWGVSEIPGERLVYLQSHSWASFVLSWWQSTCNAEDLVDLWDLGGIYLQNRRSHLSTLSKPGGISWTMLPWGLKDSDTTEQLSTLHFPK